MAAIAREDLIGRRLQRHGREAVRRLADAVVDASGPHQGTDGRERQELRDLIDELGFKGKGKKGQR